MIADVLLADVLLAAQADGLEANARRFLRFLGFDPGHTLELQILGAPRRFEENLVAHARDVDGAVRLLEEAEAKKATGVYVILNEPDAAVMSRAEPGRWHVQKKGESTTDADIVWLDGKRCWETRGPHHVLVWLWEAVNTRVFVITCVRRDEAYVSEDN